MDSLSQKDDNTGESVRSRSNRSGTYMNTIFMSHRTGRNHTP